MKLLLIVFVFCVVLSEASDERIVGGKIAGPYSFPYQVGMIMIRTSDAPYLCGGSIISEKVVLTAGHCLQNADKALVIMGSNDIASNGTEIVKQLVHRSDFRIYPHFNQFLAKLDLAILFLPEAVSFSKAIQPVKLPSEFLFEETFSGEVGTVSGFGQICDHCQSTSILRYTENRVMSNEECSGSYMRLDESHICTSTAESYSGTCRGDSGSPLTIIRNATKIQIGVSSFGYQACELGQPTVFTRLTPELLSWVRDEMKS
jgi:secreted trypsin-like serine protease